MEKDDKYCKYYNVYDNFYYTEKKTIVLTKPAVLGHKKNCIH